MGRGGSDQRSVLDFEVRVRLQGWRKPLTSGLGQHPHLGALAYLVDEDRGAIFQTACRKSFRSSFEGGLERGMDPYQAATADDRELSRVPLQQGVLTSIEEASFLLGGEHAPRVGASSPLVKKSQFPKPSQGSH
jgi:hypothetical protein